MRNRLKANLTAGKTYCVKLYVNVGNPSTYGIDGFGAYFGDNSLDTITVCYVPLTYLIPQVQNPTNNLITDTLNWTLVTGTFVATGNEKHMVIGNFKNDASTNKILINPPNLPTIFSDCAIDDVSCIPLDLPAYAHAGPDIWAVPGTTTYIGRQKDVGIDEACSWYKLPNTTSVIANVAGMTLTVAVGTETYMVKQDICGVIKYDTVVIHASGVGNIEWLALNDNLKVFPNPVSARLSIECAVVKNGTVFVKIYNNLSQMIKEETITFDDRHGSIQVEQLPQGVYTLSLETGDHYVVNKRIVISR